MISVQQLYEVAMNTLDDRERAFEAKFAHDAEMQFNVTARRNHLLGLWAAALMEKAPIESKGYAADVVKTAMSAPGDDDVIAKIVDDLSGRVDAATVRAQLVTLLQEAKAQVLSES
jgi:hypothetical protein